MSRIKVVLFDLYGTLVHQPNSVSEEEVSESLFAKGYEVSPQQFKAAWAFVAFIDYPRYGYRSWRSFLGRVFWRLKANVDKQTLNNIASLYKSRPYRLYPDSVPAVKTAVDHGFRTAIVTTIAYFKFAEAIGPIRDCFDFVMTGYETHCDKSNPRMYKKVLEILKVRPSEAVMVGDDLQLDITLPRKLGINAILLNRTRDAKGKSVDASVYDLNEAMETVIRTYGVNRNKPEKRPK